MKSNITAKWIILFHFLKLIALYAYYIFKYLPLSAWCFHYAQELPFSGWLLKCLTIELIGTQIFTFFVVVYIALCMFFSKH